MGTHAHDLPVTTSLVGAAVDAAFSAARSAFDAELAAEDLAFVGQRLRLFLDSGTDTIHHFSSGSPRPEASVCFRHALVVYTGASNGSPCVRARSGCLVRSRKTEYDGSCAPYFRHCSSRERNATRRGVRDTLVLAMHDGRRSGDGGSAGVPEARWSRGSSHGHRRQRR